MKSSIRANFVIHVLAAVLVASSAFSAPPLISYQGRLENLTPGQVGQPLSLVFRIYDGAGPSAGLVYTQTMPSVAVDSSGAFNVILGPEDDDGTALSQAFIGPDRYLSVAVDGGEELPRQQVLSVPYALNSGGNVLSNLDDEGVVAAGNVGKIVELIPSTNRLQLATDLGTQRDFLRGVYLGNGSIQLSGTASVAGAESFSPGTMLYLSNETAGAVQQADEVKTDRVFATRVGLLSGNNLVDLLFAYVPTNEIVVPPAIEFPLSNPNFENAQGWSSVNTSVIISDRAVCGSGFALQVNSPSNRYAYIFQAVQLPSSLFNFIDSSSLKADFGVTSGEARNNPALLYIRLDFYSSSMNFEVVDGDLGAARLDIPTTETGLSCEVSDRITACIPRQTRFIRYFLQLLDTDNSGPNQADILVDNAYLRIYGVETPNDCE